MRKGSVGGSRSSRRGAAGGEGCEQATGSLTGFALEAGLAGLDSLNDLATYGYRISQTFYK